MRVGLHLAFACFKIGDSEDAAHLTRRKRTIAAVNRCRGGVPARAGKTALVGEGGVGCVSVDRNASLGRITTYWISGHVEERDREVESLVGRADQDFAAGESA